MSNTKSRKTKQRPSSGPRRLRAQDLTRGYPLGDGFRLRLARPADLDRAGELLALTDVTVDDEVVAQMEAGQFAEVSLLGLDRGWKEMMRPIAEAAHDGDPGAGLGQMVLLLVVTGAEGRIVAVMQSMPVGGIFSQALARGADPIRCVWAASIVVKMQAIVVDPALQGQGIGSRLLDQTLRIHQQLGAHVVYGQFDEGSGLERYYGARGFSVAPAGHDIDLTPVTDLRVAVGAGVGERLFGWWKYPQAVRFERQRDVPIQVWEGDPGSAKNPLKARATPRPAVKSPVPQQAPSPDRAPLWQRLAHRLRGRRG